MFKKIILCITVFFITCVSAFSQQLKWSKKMARTVMTIWPDSIYTNPNKPVKWSYDQGVVLKGITGVWEDTGEGKYFQYMQHIIDPFISKDGSIRTYRPKKYKLDDINNGKILLLLYNVTGNPKYWKAATRLRKQLNTQPRTPGGGFWHKKIYPHQMWLDGLYMAEPFYAHYAEMAHDTAAFYDVARQFILMNRHARDPNTGLLYHGWDASKKQKWANPVTGDSPNFWGRADGWYAMALVDALDYFPKNFSKRDSLIRIFRNLSAAIRKYQDPQTGLWWQVLDEAHRKGNYQEASASCMFVYALAKGVLKGYLPDSYLKTARKGFKGIVKHLIKTGPNGQINLIHTCSVAGLGGHPYRDGSFKYYISEPKRTNDPKGIGSFIMASIELERAGTQSVGKGYTVTLDNYFNDEHRKDVTGHMVSYHYVWQDRRNSGYWTFGHIFRNYGVKTNELKTEPTAKNLKHSNIYIIVDPDTKKETSDPHYIQPKDTKVIYKWVKQGGVLVLLGNDKGNAEFAHFNQLAGKFGIHFNENSVNDETDHHFGMAALTIPEGNPIFRHEKVYIKELSTQTLNSPGKADFKKGNNVIFSVSHVGKGTVFALGDPWFYNEYTDGQKLPLEYHNYDAAQQFVKWLISKVPGN